MSQSPPAGTDSGPVELSESDRHLLLSVERRRVALDVLTNGSPPIFLEDLAVAVAEREVHECVTNQENVEDVAISLHHRHLPKMADLGVVDYDPGERLVTRTPATDSSDGETTITTGNPVTQRRWYLTELSDTDRHRLLAHERRRAALDVLTELTPPVELKDVAAQVAVRESDGLISSDEHEASVAIALHHGHLPKLDELGIIEYDPKESRVKQCPIVAPTTHGYPTH